jgi:aerobic C4-dicarboxylate transport protein
MANITSKKPFYRNMFLQVILAVLVGILLGIFSPDFAVKMEPFGSAFIKLVKMMIAPIIFCTVVLGIAKMGDLKEVGRVGVKSLIYFEVITTLALLMGLVVVNLLQPGSNVDTTSLDIAATQKYTDASGSGSVNFLLNIIPHSLISAFSEGDVLQILLVSVLMGIAIVVSGDKRGEKIISMLEEFLDVMFVIINMIMKLAPIGAFGAMAFTVGKYGVSSLDNIGFLVLCVYGTCALFIFLVLGFVAKLAGFSLWQFLVYIRKELALVLGTSSSESALPSLMKKLENLGCKKSVVGMVVPTGYSFNLDGTSIYLTMAAVFIAQATNVSLSLTEQLGIVAILLLTSKGAAGVTGSGFIVLASTLAAFGKIPLEGLALLLGVDRFMSGARAITNVIGNGVAAVVIAKWENALDVERMNKVLNNKETEESQSLTEEQGSLETLAFATNTSSVEEPTIDSEK